MRGKKRIRSLSRAGTACFWIDGEVPSLSYNVTIDGEDIRLGAVDSCSWGAVSWTSFQAHSSTRDGRQIYWATVPTNMVSVNPSVDEQPVIVPTARVDFGFAVAVALFDRGAAVSFPELPIGEAPADLQPLGSECFVGG